MARKPAGGADPASFAGLLHALLSAGQRPAGTARAAWTNAAFARALPAEGGTAVSPTTVARWRAGTQMPRDLAPILAALFGPEIPGVTDAAREALRNAFVREKAARAAAVLAKARDPAGAVWTVLDNGQFDIDDRAAPTDTEAASRPEVTQRHGPILRKLRTLLAAVGERLDNQRVWQGLKPALEELRTAADRPTPDLAGQVVALHDAMLSVASFIDQDNAILGNRDSLFEPLPEDIRRALSDLVATGAPWVRAFPTARAADDEAGAFLARPELFEPARRLIEIAREEDAVTERAAARVARQLEVAERPGFQAQKAGNRVIGTLRNLIQTAGGLAAGLIIGAVSSNLAELQSAKVAANLILRGERQIIALAEGLPADLRAAVEALVAAGRAKPPLPADDPPALPAFPPRPDEPPPNFDLDEVKRMILAGRAPPAAWVPFILNLDFDGETLRDLAPLAGLTSLKTLWLNDTQVHDLAPLAKLTSLETLWLNNTPVGDLAPLAGLARLQLLVLNNTQVGDLAPLAGLTSLQTLSLDNTPLGDLAPLAGLTSLESLYLSNTPAADFAPLAHLSKLEIRKGGRTFRPADAPPARRAPCPRR